MVASQFLFVGDMLIGGSLMKKIMLVFILVCISSFLLSITLADLDFEEQLLVKDYVISLDEEISYANVEELEGVEYEVIYESDDYIIIVKDGNIYILPKE